tara:strand:- start:6434 stop:6628 length:195 start_codon:yes stop_codon:yes gene_type:complete
MEEILINGEKKYTVQYALEAVIKEFEAKDKVRIEMHRIKDGVYASHDATSIGDATGFILGCVTV